MYRAMMYPQEYTSYRIVQKNYLVDCDEVYVKSFDRTENVKLSFSF